MTLNRSAIEHLPLQQLVQRITDALQSEYDTNVANITKKYVLDEFEETEELLDELEEGVNDSCIIDDIIDKTQINDTDSQTILNLLIESVN